MYVIIFEISKVAEPEPAEALFWRGAGAELKKEHALSPFFFTNPLLRTSVRRPFSRSRSELGHGSAALSILNLIEDQAKIARDLEGALALKSPNEKCDTFTVRRLHYAKIQFDYKKCSKNFLRMLYF